LHYKVYDATTPFLFNLFYYLLFEMTYSHAVVATLSQKERYGHAVPFLQDASDFNDQTGIESLTKLIRIAALIAQNSRRSDLVIDVVMRVTMNPKWNSAWLDE